MKKTILVISILIVVSALTVGIVMAQTDNPETPGYPGNPGFRGGMMGGYYREEAGYMSEYMHAAFAEALGISVEDFESRMEAGETMYDIALSLGFETEEIAAIHYQARQAAFELAYADGFITDEHYQSMQDRMNGEYGFSKPGGGYGMHGGGYGGGFGGGFGRGGGGCHGTYQETPVE